MGAYLKKRNIVLKGASVLQTIALVALVFVMGARIGSEDEIVRSLDTIGLKALVITLFIMAGTVLTAFVVRKLLGFDKYGNLKKAKDAKGTDVVNAEVCGESCKAQGEDEILAQPAEEAKSDKTMLLTIFIPVTLGI